MMLELNSGDTAWVLTSAALVLLMTPGLAFFYGGMVRAKSVLNMMMMSFISMGVIGVLWVLFGYSMSFGNSLGGLGILGDPLEFAGLQGLITYDPSASLPSLFSIGMSSGTLRVCRTQSMMSDLNSRIRSSPSDR